MSLPLEGLRVVDFGQGVAGPYCAQLLGDQGADVIKIEPPRGDWSRTMGVQEASGQSGTFIAVNRNKRDLCLDLKMPRALDIARKLALSADVVVESFRPGVMQRLGLGYDALHAVNPRLVYCGVTGFGDSGPNVNIPASDSVMQPYGGLMSITGERGGEPLRIGNVVSDMVAGTNAFSGILVALLARAASGQGRRISVSLLASIVAFQASPLTEFLVTGKTPQRLGNDHPMTTPSGVFRTLDGAISLTVMDHMWSAFCAGIGVVQITELPAFRSAGARHDNRDALRQALAPIFSRRSSADWLESLRAMDILCAPINDYPTLVKDPQVVHSELIQWVTDSGGVRIPMLKNPVVTEGERSRLLPPPRLGEHNREILLNELGYSSSQVEEALEEGAIRNTYP